jgi:hypothetical protein
MMFAAVAAAGWHGASVQAQAGAGASGPAGAESLCDLASPEDVGDKLVLPNVLAPAITTSPTVTLCEYLQQGSPMFTVRVRFERGVNAATFVNNRRVFDNAGWPTRDVALGDTAFFTSQQLAITEINTLVVLDGDLQLLISSFAPVEAEIALANRILEQL